MQHEEQKRFWLAWSLTPRLGSDPAPARKRFLPIIKNAIAPGQHGKVARGVLSDLLAAFRAQELKAVMEREWEEADRIGCRILTLADEAYPGPLREIPDPPPALYLIGNLVPADDLAIAVVGARGATPYGLQASRWISRDLAAAGLTVVSGLARGVDTEAHRGALEAGGRTIAVLGSGLAVVYPPENRALCEEIARNGAVLSPYPLQEPPRKQNFPARNRILSGLTLGTLVVEAAERSGSLITARLALEQDREVFAVPGRITCRTSVGTNYLIKAGAKLVQSATDILEELPRDAQRRLNPTPKPEKPGANKMEPLSVEEEGILAILSADEAVHIDTLAEKASMGTAELLSRLLTLEMGGRVVQLPGQHYILRL